MEPPHFPPEDVIPGLIKIEDSPRPQPPSPPSSLSELPELSANELDPMSPLNRHCSGGGNLLDESLIKEEILREFGYGEQQQQDGQADVPHPQSPTTTLQASQSGGAAVFSNCPGIYGNYTQSGGQYQSWSSHSMSNYFPCYYFPYYYQQQQQPEQQQQQQQQLFQRQQQHFQQQGQQQQQQQAAPAAPLHRSYSTPAATNSSLAGTGTGTGSRPMTFEDMCGVIRAFHAVSGDIVVDAEVTREAIFQVILLSDFLGHFEPFLMLAATP